MIDFYSNTSSDMNFQMIWMPKGILAIFCHKKRWSLGTILILSMLYHPSDLSILGQMIPYLDYLGDALLENTKISRENFHDQ